MGDCGFEAIRYRGRYYIFYQKRNAEPNELGDSIVHGIPSESKKYQKWLASQRENFEEQHEDVEMVLSVRANNDHNICRNWRAIHISQYDRDEFPSYEPPNMSKMFAFWGYITDYDKEIFTVSEYAHLKTPSAPKDSWLNVLCNDTDGNHFLVPGIIPDESLTDLVLPLAPVSQEVTNAYQDLGACTVQAKIPAKSKARQQGAYFSSLIWNIFQSRYQRTLEQGLPGWSHKDFIFRELAYAILCIATPFQNISLWKSCRTLDSPDACYSDLVGFDITAAVTKDAESSQETPSADDDNDEGSDRTSPEPVHGDCRDASADSSKDDAKILHLALSDAFSPEFVSHLGTGSHIAQNPAGTSPEDSVYWFQGALIMLTEQLQRKGAVEERITRLMAYHPRHNSQQSTKAVIISVEHIVLVNIGSANNITHTEPLPLFDLDTSVCKGPFERYPRSYLEAMQKYVRERSTRQHRMDERHKQETEMIRQSQRDDDTCSDRTSEAFWKQLGEINHRHDQEIRAEKERADNDLAQIVSECEQEVKEFGYKPLKPGTTEDTFLALVNFFDVVARRDLISYGGRLPTEILCMILRYTDLETWRTCMSVSKIFRDICQCEARLHEDFVFVPPFSESTTMWDADWQGNGEEIMEMEMKMMVLPVGVPRRVSARKTMEGDKGDETYRIVLGHKRDRRSLPSVGLTFESIDY